MTDKDPSPRSPDAGDTFFVLPNRDKLEAMAEFAAGAGHEINNPLATIIGRAQLLLKGEMDPQRRQMLMSIGAQAYRIRDMIGDTMLFARPPAPELGDVNLLGVVQKTVRTQSEELNAENSTVSLSIDEAITVRADSMQLSIVFSELLRNCRQALLPHGGEIQISAVVQDHRVVITIFDQGKGFNPVERQHAFDPFYSGRQAGRGLGFGLSKCWRIVNLHGGQIEIESSASGPTTIRVTWPIA